MLGASDDWTSGPDNSRLEWTWPSPRISTLCSRRHLRDFRPNRARLIATADCSGAIRADDLHSFSPGPGGQPDLASRSVHIRGSLEPSETIDIGGALPDGSSWLPSSSSSRTLFPTSSACLARGAYCFVSESQAPSSKPRSMARVPRSSNRSSALPSFPILTCSAFRLDGFDFEIEGSAGKFELENNVLTREVIGLREVVERLSEVEDHSWHWIRRPPRFMKRCKVRSRLCCCSRPGHAVQRVLVRPDGMVAGAFRLILSPGRARERRHQ